MPSAQALDRSFADVGRRAQFLLTEGQRYFAGHSLGPATRGAADHLQNFVAEQWAPAIVGGWNQHRWLEESKQVSTALAPLLGCHADAIAVCDSTSVNLFKLLSLAIDRFRRQAPGKPWRVGIERGAFPGDRYVCESLVTYLNPSEGQLVEFDRSQMAEALRTSCDIAVCATVDYRSADRVDMAALESIAQGSGCQIIWDLCHAVGAVPLDLAGDGVRMAVGCTYKYLNGGPGAPAFAVYRPTSAAFQPSPRSALVGWFGHAEPFQFDSEFRPAGGAAQLACGTPSIVALKALNFALQAWQGLDLQRLRALGVSLAEFFLAGLDTRPSLAELTVDSPAPGPNWGSHVSLRHSEAHAIVRCLADSGIVADFRGPDCMRFAICPLYTQHVDIEAALSELERILMAGRHQDERYEVRRGVP